MARRMTAYCGLDCSACPAYIARRTDDQELRVQTALEWGSDEFPVSPEDIGCDGCRTPDGARWAWCQECAVRACASARGVLSCATCIDFGCDKLQAFFDTAGTEARERLVAVRGAHRAVASDSEVTRLLP